MSDRALELSLKSNYGDLPLDDPPMAVGNDRDNDPGSEDGEEEAGVGDPKVQDEDSE